MHFHKITVSDIVVSMNNTNTNYPFKKSRKPLIIGVSSTLLLVGLVAYGITAYNTPLWPFTATIQETGQEDKNSSNNLTQSDITFEKPTINNDTKTARFFANIDTKEQGDCVLTLKSQSDTITFKTTTQGLDHGETGCLDWNISTDALEKGLYDAEIAFTQKNGNTIKSTSQIKIP